MIYPPRCREETRLVEVEGAVLAGTFAYPASGESWPVVLLLGGTFGDLRDGDVDPRLFPDAPKRGMYALLAGGLAEAGIASFRFDRRGAGESTGRFDAGRAQEVVDAKAVWRWVRSLREGNGTAAMVGHSAGAYVLCRVALEAGQPDAAVLQGALYRSIPELLEYNSRPVLEYMKTGEAQARWVEEHAPRAYRGALMLDAVLAAIENGDRTARAVIDGTPVERDLGDLDYDLRMPPEDQFRHLKAPTLVLHAAEDSNVPVEDAFNTVRALWTASNREVELHLVPGANHSFQMDDLDPETQLREKMTLQNFARPFHTLYPAAVIDYLSRRLLPDTP